MLRNSGIALSLKETLAKTSNTLDETTYPLPRTLQQFLKLREIVGNT